MLWNKKFAFGIETIDDQHKELFRLLERTSSLINDAKDGFDCYQEIEDVLGELESYTIYHFEEEEKLLHEHGYSDIENHSEEHERFVSKIHDTLDSDFDYQQHNVLEEVHGFLLEWVSEHILLTDAKYVSTVKG